MAAGKAERADGGASDPGASRAASRELLRDYHVRGDRTARERLIDQYMPLVRRLARRFAGRGEQFEDLVQVGSIGLMHAIDRFEADRGVDLPAFAIPTISGEIQRHLRDRVWPVKAPRRLRELGLSLEAGAAELARRLERPATTTELAHQAGLPREEVVEALAAARSRAPRSLSASPAADDERTSSTVIPAFQDEGFELSEDRAVLCRAFRVLDERERRVLHLGFFEGLPQSRIARELGISQIHVSRLTRRALEKLRVEIGSE